MFCHEHSHLINIKKKSLSNWCITFNASYMQFCFSSCSLGDDDFFWTVHWISWKLLRFISFSLILILTSHWHHFLINRSRKEGIMCLTYASMHIWSGWMETTCFEKQNAWGEKSVFSVNLTSIEHQKSVYFY